MLPRFPRTFKFNNRAPCGIPGNIYKNTFPEVKKIITVRKWLKHNSWPFLGVSNISKQNFQKNVSI